MRKISHAILGVIVAATLPACATSVDHIRWGMSESDVRSEAGKPDFVVKAGEGGVWHYTIGHEDCAVWFNAGGRVDHLPYCRPIEPRSVVSDSEGQPEKKVVIPASWLRNREIQQAKDDGTYDPSGEATDDEVNTAVDEAKRTARHEQAIEDAKAAPATAGSGTN